MRGAKLCVLGGGGSGVGLGRGEARKRGDMCVLVEEKHTVAIDGKGGESDVIKVGLPVLGGAPEQLRQVRGEVSCVHPRRQLNQQQQN